MKIKTYQKATEYYEHIKSLRHMRAYVVKMINMNSVHVKEEVEEKFEGLLKSIDDNIEWVEFLLKGL